MKNLGHIYSQDIVYLYTYIYWDIIFFWKYAYPKYVLGRLLAHFCPENWVF